MSAYVNAGTDLLDVMGGGIPDDSVKQWLMQKTSAVQGALSNTGQAFFNRAREMYQMVSETQALQMLRNLRGKSDSVWTSNHIQCLHTLAQLQTAGPIMQRWVMAQPDIRERYLNQTLEGYGESYTNYHGDAVGEHHFDYRRVMHGVVEVLDGERDFRIRHYFDYMGEEERDLTLHERLDILNTWDWVKHYLDEGGEDPTSPYGAQL